MNRPSLAKYASSGRPLLLWLTAATLLCWLIAFIAIGYPWTMVGSSLDGLSYLWMADALNHGVSRPESAFGAQLLFHGRLPPGYPLFLSTLGADSSEAGMLRANLAQMGSVLALALLIGIYAHQRTRSILAALLVVVYSMAHPMITPWAFELFSEPLYTAMLIVICMIAGNERIPRGWLWAALLIGFACLVRSIGVVLIPALMVLLMQRSWLKAGLAGGLAAIPSLIWQISKGQPAEGSGGSYLAQWQSQLQGTDGHWMELALTQVSSLIRSIAPGGLPEAWRLLLGATLLMLFLSVAWQQRRRPTFDTLAILGTLAILAIWPFPGYLDRLSGPIVPLLLIGLIHHCLAPPVVPSPRTRQLQLWLVGSSTLLVLTAMFSTLLMLIQPAIRSAETELTPFMRNASALTADDPQFIAKIHLASALTARDLATQIPTGQCISSTFAYWLRLFASVPVMDTVTPFSWTENPCRYVFLINVESARDGFSGLYPMPLPQDQYTLVLVSREAPQLPMLAAVIERKDP